MPIGRNCKRAAASKLTGGAHVEQKGHDTHYGPTYSAAPFANMTRYGPASLLSSLALFLPKNND